MKIKGDLLVNSFSQSQKLNYQIVEKVFDFKKADCIVVKYLNSDFTILLDNIQTIITERGSALSHLAIIAREYGKTIVRAKGIINKIPKTGQLLIKYDKKKRNVEIEVF